MGLYSANKNIKLDMVVRNNFIKFANDNLEQVVQQMHKYEFGFATSYHNINVDQLEDVEPILLKNELCASDAACSYNCELVPSTENYTMILNKTVAEDNQTAHENNGWECETTLNNVSRCANDLYAQNQTYIQKYKQERNYNVCYDSVSPSVQLDRIEVGALEILDLDDICQSQMNGTTTQKVLCQQIPAHANWNFTVSAGGNYK